MLRKNRELNVAVSLGTLIGKDAHRTDDCESQGNRRCLALVRGFGLKIGTSDWWTR